MYRTKLLTIAFALCITQLTLAQKLPSISDGWKFHKGDDTTWSHPKLDESNWQPIPVGQPWEKQLGDYNGFGWYRLHVHIPANLRDSPKFQQRAALTLSLGKIDDVDQTWFNGNPIGSTGTFPEDYSPAWQDKRAYRIPADMIRWDQDNVIAVRVYDGKGNGGMLEGPYRLAIADKQIDIQFVLGDENPDGIFRSDKPRTTIAIAAKFTNKDDTDEATTLRWTIQNDEGQERITESAQVTLAANKTTTHKTEFAANPGFYRVICELLDENNDVTKKHSTIVGLNPEQITAPLAEQPDLDSFWKTTLASLAKIDPQYKMTRAPDRDSATHNVYEIEMRSLDNIRVRGWYQRPKTDSRYPALIRVPGYTSSMQPIETADPIAVFSFNVRAHGNSQQDVSGQPQDYWIRGLDDKNGYFYQGCYADCIRAVDFLCSRDEIDNSRIGITGGSQGGGLSLATAALDSRISACAPDIPFLCNWVKYFKTTKWPEIDGWIAAKPERTWETTLNTMSYFDAMNLADRIKCPVFLGLGLQDDVCPPATIFATYNRLKVPKQYYVYHDAGHWVGSKHHELRRKWLWKQLGVTN